MMKVVWKGDGEANPAHVLYWHGVHFVPNAETEVPADFPSIRKLKTNPAFVVVSDRPAVGEKKPRE